MLLDLLAILVLQVLYVAVMTVRWIILVRGSRWTAAAISFFEVIIYVIGLGLVFSNLRDPARVMMYAVGYALGSLVGSYVEERLALGHSVFQIISRQPARLVPALRGMGIGVTSWQAEGREGPRELLMVVTRRRSASDLLGLVHEIDPQAFMIRLDPQALHGGFVPRLSLRKWG